MNNLPNLILSNVKAGQHRSEEGLLGADLASSSNLELLYQKSTDEILFLIAIVDG